MTQIIAILTDSLRYLKSRALFWIALGLSGLVAIMLFGMINFDETGWSVLWFDSNKSDILREGTFGSRQLLSWLFGGAFVFWWLAWGAIILALISTASLIPDFVAGGSIDLTLSKPIGRLKLFVTKVGSATLFMLLQVTVGVVLAYLLIGLRFGMWFHAALWAIPLLVIQFLYLYVPMTLVGLITRSPLASLLSVLVFWGSVSVVQFSSNQLDSAVAQSQAMIDRLEKRRVDLAETAQQQGRELTPGEESRRVRWESDKAPHQQTLEMVGPWQGRLKLIEMIVPKTGDVQKIIAELVEAPTFSELMMALGGMDEEAMAAMTGINDREMAEDMTQSSAAGARAIRSVNFARSLGSSLAFTFVVLGIAVVIFVRRDF